MNKLKLEGTAIQALAHALKSVDLFAPLTVGQLDIVLPYITLYAYGPEEKVFKQGDPADAFYIINQGKVAIKTKSGFFGFTKTLATLEAGAMFGEMAVIERRTRKNSAVCLAPTTLFVLLAQDFNFILGNNPAFAAALEKTIALRKFENAHRR